jgi:two-component system chemotaxis sensor kinase CheA
MSMGVDRSAYMESFREEMLEHLQAVTQALLSVESRPEDTSAVGEVFRRVHTIKGSARMMGFGEVAELAHAMEDVLDDLRSGRLRASPPLLDAMLTAVDLLRELTNNPPVSDAERPDVQAVLRWLGDLRGGGGGHQHPQPRATLPQRPTGEGGDKPVRETVRLDVARIDTILNLAGELMVVDAARRQWTDELLRWLDAMDKDARPVHDGEGSPGLPVWRSQLAKQCRRAMAEETELVRELHYQVSILRMLPVRSILSTLPRAARDLAREENKEVEVVVEGEDTEVDREVLERVRDPILHLVTNAVHHGIEPPSVRLAAGKPRSGLIRIGAYSRGEQAIIEVEDDGVGIDFRAVRRAAVEKGVLSPAEEDTLPDAESIRLLFLPGLTTSRQVSDSSGRGVGLDVVRAEMDALKGRVSVESRPGEGTRITLEMPITLAFTHVLLVEIGRSTYGIPCASTQGIAEVPLGAVHTLQAREAVDMTGRTVPLVWTHRILGVESGLPIGVPRIPALLLGPEERPMAFVVDRVIGDENAIVKPLGPMLRRVPNVSGGIILGDGRVALLLSAGALLDAAPAGLSGAPERAEDASGTRASGAVASGGVLDPSGVPQRRAKSARVLVVDDAAISRELERSILASAGYEVETAVDGVDALGKLGAKQFSLVVADVEMPRMGGLQLTAAIRADPRLQDLPIVIVSARESEEDRRRGMEMGAQAYVGKGSFDETTLLDTIESLIG